MSSYVDKFITAYSYDNRSQMTGATSSAIAGMSPSFLPAAESYNFDATGNRSTEQSTSGAHNRVQSDGNYTYQYDAEGNTTKRTSIADGSVREMVWDYRGRLNKLTDRSSASGAATLGPRYRSASLPFALVKYANPSLRNLNPRGISYACGATFARAKVDFGCRAD